MKQFLTIVALLIGATVFGQISTANVFNYVELTTAQRDALSTPAGQFPKIYNSTTAQFERWNGSAWVAEETAEVNDLSSVVTWANVPDANITQTSVTQHQAVLSITESQISDLNHTTDTTRDIASSAEVNTGTDNTKAISPLALAGSQLQTDVTANNAKVSNATHTGDVTGATALTIATDAVDIPMLSATGTADGTTFLRGDNTWGVPAGTGANQLSDLTDVGVSTPTNGNVLIGDGTDFDSGQLDGLQVSLSLGGLSATNVTSGINELYVEKGQLDGNNTWTGTNDFDVIGLFDAGSIGFTPQALPGGNTLRQEFGVLNDNTFFFETGINTGFRLYLDPTALTANRTLTMPDSAVDLGDIATNNAKVSNATHTGDVTGSTALTITDEAVTLAKMAHVATATILGRTTATTGDVEALTAAQARGVLNVEDNAAADQNAAEVSVAATPVNYTAATADVEAHLVGIDAAINSGISTENQERIDNIGVLFRRSLVASETLTIEGSDPTSVGDRGKTVLNTMNTAADTITVNNVETLNRPFMVQAGFGIADSTYIRRNNTTIKWRGDMNSTVQVADDVDGFFLRPGQKAVVERVAADLYEVDCTCFPHTEASCTADPNEWHTQANAASDPNCNEADATTGWTSAGANIFSVTDDPQVGTYHLEFRAFNGLNNRAEYTFSATASDTFTVSWKDRQDIGTNGNVYNWGNCTGGPNYVPSSTWTDRSFNITVTSTGTVTLRWYASDGSGSAGDEIDLDNLSIIKTN